MFGDLANYVAASANSGKPPQGGGASQPSKPPPKQQDTTTSLLAKALAARGVQPRGATANATANAAPAPAALVATTDVRCEPRQEAAEASDELPTRAKRTQPTKGEYEAQQRARLSELHAEITSSMATLRSATRSVVVAEFPDEQHAAHAAREYALGWIRLLRGLWEQEVVGLAYEQRFELPAAKRSAAEFARYAGQLRPVEEGMGQDVVAFNAAVASAAPLPTEYNVPADIARDLRDVFVAVARGKFLAVEEAFMKITMGSAAWQLGLFSGGNIHMRRNLDKVQKSVVKHVMNNVVAKDFLLAARMLTTVAERYQRGVLQLPWTE